MKFFLWCGAGALSIGIPVIIFYFYNPTDLWGSVAGGAVGGSLFILVLVFSALKAFPTKLERGITTGMVIFFVTVYALYAEQWYRTTSYQREMLTLIRTYIGSGVILSDKIYNPLIPVMRRYHQQPPAARRPITKVFLSMYGNQIADSTFNKYENREAGANVMDAVTFVSMEGDSIIRLTVVDTIARGTDPLFVNATGHLGKLEFHAAVSAKGVTHERVN